MKNETHLGLLGNVRDSLLGSLDYTSSARFGRVSGIFGSLFGLSCLLLGYLFGGLLGVSVGGVLA